MQILYSEHLSLNYGSNNVIADLNFSVAKGEFLCLIGENGCGKTTLLKAIAGLIAPKVGKLFFEKDFSRKDIGYLPQQTRIQKDFPASVWEVVLSGFQGRCGLRPFYCFKERIQAMRNLNRFGISDLSSRCYGELSGGQQQRVLLARTLCASRKLLLLDEPTTGLDPKSSEKMYQIISELNHSEGITIVMVSHDVETASKYCSRVFQLGGKKNDPS